MMLGFVHGLQDGYEVQLLSGHPDETYRNYNISSVPRRDMKLVEAAIAKTDALVFPGGSIFQDVTSVASVKYYSSLVAMAKKSRKKVLLLGQGVGPLNSFFSRHMAGAAFASADAISVRDPQSMKVLQELGIKRAPRVSADCAFLLPRPARQEASENYGIAGMNTIGIAARPLGRKTDVAGLFGDFCRLLFQSGNMPVLLEMDKEEDRPLLDEISKKQGGKVPDLRKLHTPMQIQQRIDRMDAVVAMRLHAGILATTVGVPPLMVSYDPKVTAFSKMLEVAPTVTIEGLTSQRLFDIFSSFIKDNERNRKIVERKREEMSKLAQVNIEIVRDLVRPQVMT
jgi:polysaccharide pyruvyl transferase CsaB